MSWSQAVRAAPNERRRATIQSVPVYGGTLHVLLALHRVGQAQDGVLGPDVGRALAPGRERKPAARDLDFGVLPARIPTDVARLTRKATAAWPGCCMLAMVELEMIVNAACSNKSAPATTSAERTSTSTRGGVPG